MHRSIAAMAFALAMPTGQALAAPLPQDVMAIIDAAADDPSTLGAVVKAIKKAHPADAAEVDAYAALSGKRLAEAKRQQVADQSFFEGWTGKGELGGSISAGNTDDHGVSAALAFDKKTEAWEQDANLSINFKSENQETTTDRYFATYAVRHNLRPRLYAVGVLWGERDRFAGHNFRFSEGIGVGYRLLDRPRLALRVEGGPALRQSDYLVTGYEATVAARLAGYLRWQISQRLEFSQSLVTYLDTANSTVLAASALTTNLYGNLSARASYEVRHEEDPPQGREPTDTTTRATLVFSF
jgi:putative salt-induced outer membrane protein